MTAAAADKGLAIAELEALTYENQRLKAEQQHLLTEVQVLQRKLAETQAELNRMRGVQLRGRK